MKLGGSVLQPAVEFGGDGPVDLELWLPGQTAAGHDHIDVPQRAEVVQRVSLRDDQIGALAAATVPVTAPSPASSAARPVAVCKANALDAPTYLWK